MIKPEVSPYCFLPNCRRLGDLLFATASMCLGTSTRGKNPLPENTVHMFPPYGCRSFRTRKPPDALHLLPVSSSLLTPHTQPVLLPCKETSLLLCHPLGARRQHDSCTLMSNALAASDIFATKLERGGQMWAASHLSPLVRSGILTP